MFPSMARVGEVFVTRAPRLAVPCGAVLTPRGGERKSAALYLAALLFSAGLWALTAALFPLSPIFIGVGAALQCLSIASYARVLVSDPGVLPKHVTAVGFPAVPGTAAFATPEHARLGEPVLVDVSLCVRRGGGAPAPASPAAPCMAKFCVTCRIWRPPGAHHCSTCGVCVLGFDHHCGVVGKCVGAGNLRAFLAFTWAQTCQYAFNFLYCLSAVITGVLDDAGVATDDPGAWVSGQSQVALWGAGGGLLGYLLLCGLCGRRRALVNGTGAAGTALFILLGTACTLAAYGRVSTSHGALSPALIGVPLFLYSMLMALLTAIGQTCTAAENDTTAAKYRRMMAVGHGRASTLTLAGRVAGVLRLACSFDHPPLVRLQDDAGPAQAAVQAALLDLALEAEAREARKMELWAAHFRSENPLVHSPGGLATSNVVVQSGAARGVDEAGGDTGGRTPVGASDAAPPTPPQHTEVCVSCGELVSESETRVDEWRAACDKAFALSLDSAYVDDAVRVATDPRVVGAVANVRGLLAGLDFLVPGVDYTAQGVGDR